MKKIIILPFLFFVILSGLAQLPECSVTTDISNVTCFGNNDGSITVDVSGCEETSNCFNEPIIPITDCNSCSQQVTSLGNQPLYVNSGEQICITQEINSNGTIEVKSGGTLVVCASLNNVNLTLNANATLVIIGELNLSHINANFETAKIFNYGTFNLSQGLALSAEIQNYGVLSVMQDFDINALKGKVFNYDSIYVGSNLNSFHQLVNNSVIHVNGTFNNNSMTNIFNNCRFFVGQNMNHNSSSIIINEGFFTVNGTTTINGNAILTMGDETALKTTSIMVNGRIEYNGNACALVSVTNGFPTPNGGSFISPSITQCSGNNNCGCTPSIGTGAAPVFTWTDVNESTNTRDNLIAGTYELGVTCESTCSSIIPITVNQPLPLNLLLTPGTTLGSATSSVSGGTIPYSYQWISLGQLKSIQANPTNLDAGIYTVIVTDANGCSTEKQITIDTPDLPNCEDLPTVTVRNVSCFGKNDGRIEILNTNCPSGGGGSSNCATGPFTPSIDCNNCTPFTGSLATGQTACIPEGSNYTQQIELTAGTLIICGSASNAGVVLSGTAKIIVLGSFSPANINFNSDEASIENYGTITINGTLPVRGTFVNYGSLTTSDDLNINDSPTALFQNHGSIQVNNSLNVSKNFENYGFITIESQFQINATGIFENFCTIVAKGNVLINNLLINHGLIENNFTGKNLHINGSGILEVPAGGNYQANTIQFDGIIRSNDDDCSLVQVHGLLNNGNPEDAIGNVEICVSGNETNCSCVPIDPTSNSGGSSSTSNAFINWTSLGITGPVADNLVAGDYPVTITCGTCIKETTYTVGQPNKLFISLVNQQSAACPAGFDGMIEINVTGGSGNYIYEWSDGFKTIQPEATTQINNLTPGVYTITVTEVGDNHCFTTRNISIGTTANDCPCAGDLAINLTPNSPSCGEQFDGSVYSSVSGGSGNYAYLWNTMTTSPNLFMVGSGKYSVRVVDLQSFDTCYQSVTLTTPAGPKVQVSAFPSTNLCNSGDVIVLNAITSTNVSYKWNISPPENEEASIVISQVGTYNVLVTDLITGCTGSDQIDISNDGSCLPPGSGCPSSITPDPTPVSCSGEANGSINLVFGEPYADLIVVWDNFSRGPQLSDVPAGTYTATIYHLSEEKKYSTCRTVTATVTEPSPINVGIDVDGGNVLCGNDQNVTLTVTGSIGDYKWFPSSETTSQITPTGPGIYKVRVTQGKCSNVSEPVTILSIPDNITIRSFEDSVCPNRALRLISSASSSNTWSTGETTNSILISEPGVYGLEVQSGFCSSRLAEITIHEKQDCGKFNLCEPAFVPTRPAVPCEQYQFDKAFDRAVLIYNDSLDAIKKAFQQRYIEHCMNSYTEKYDMEYTGKEYHYTLYYYDQAGNLVRTVPPAGVKRLDNNVTASISNQRANNYRQTFTEHDYLTTYKYNTLNQVVAQNLPDHNTESEVKITSANLGLPSNINIRKTAFNPDGSGLLVGEVNGVTQLFFTNSINGGWVPFNTLSTDNVNDIQLVSGSSTAYAVGDKGLFLKSDDQGTTWSTSSLPTLGNLGYVHFNTTSVGSAIETDGTVWYTNTGGNSWTAYVDLNGKIGRNGLLTDVVFDANGNATASSIDPFDKSVLYTSENLGRTWVRVSKTKAVDLNTVQQVNQNLAFAAGDDGRIYKSFDGGLTWRALNSKQNRPIDLIHFSDELHGIIQLNNGELWLTQDAGNSWSQPLTGSFPAINFYTTTEGYASAATGQLFAIATNNEVWISTGVPAIAQSEITAIHFTSAQRGMIGGLNRQLYSTEDGGTTWTPLTVDASGNQFVKSLTFFNSSNPNGFLLLSNGDTYQFTANTSTSSASLELISNTQGDIIAFDFQTQKLGKALTDNEKILNYIDNGVTKEWQLEANATGFGLQALDLSLQPQGFAVGTEGSIITTSNFGTTWFNRSNNVNPEALYSLSQINTVTYAAGEGGTILQSTTDGSFHQLPSGIQERIEEIHFATTNNGYLRTVTDDLYVTTNGGITWTLQTASGASITSIHSTNNGTFFATKAAGQITNLSSGTTATTPVTNQQVNSLSFGSGTTGLAAGQQGLLYKSTDNGSSWVSSTSFNAPDIQDFATIGNVTYAVGNNGSVLKIENLGQTITNIPAGITTDLNSVAFRTTTRGVAVGDNGIILRTNDGGLDNFTAPVNNGGISNIKLTSVDLNGTTGVIGGVNGTLLYTSNGGATWSIESIGGTRDILAVFVVDNSTAFAIGENGLILKRTNSTWIQQTNGATDWVTSLNGTTQDLRDLYFSSPLVGYLVGNSGVVLSTKDGGATYQQEALNTGNNLTSVSAQSGDIVIGGENGQVNSIQLGSGEFTERFWYDEVGRPVFSQTARQAALPTPGYTYLIYDEISRIIESGEVQSITAPVTLNGSESFITQNNIFNFIAGKTKREVTHTYYDVSPFTIPDFEPTNLRNRIAATTYDLVEDGTTYDHATHYSYDENGNVKTLIQDFPELQQVAQRYKQLDYEFELISGNINIIHYQNNKVDQYHYQFKYDNDDRLSKVFSSPNQINWQEDYIAFYYAHLPLSRSEIGQEKVQGMDYATTIQGWVKGCNTNTLIANTDMGKDGAQGSKNAFIPQDEFGFSLEYFTGDYTPVGGSTANFLASLSGSDLETSSKDLFNGNIKTKTNAILAFQNDGKGISANNYEYDQLNRLVNATFHQDANVANSGQWGSTTQSDNYKTNYSYDANGNLLTLGRNAHLNTTSDGTGMDDLAYIYENKVNGFAKNTNKLVAAQDNSNFKVNGIDDLQPGQVFNSTLSSQNNYQYDASGNLTADLSEGIVNIEWNKENRIEKITRSDTSHASDLEFQYDAMGNRVVKIVKPRDGNGIMPQTEWTYTYYVKDAQGQTISIDELTTTVNSGTISTNYHQKETILIGGKRIGYHNHPDKPIARKDVAGTAAQIVVFEEDAADGFLDGQRGERLYEQANHLGNVVVVTSDRRLQESNNNLVVKGYQAEALSINDVYPFGMVMPDRCLSSDLYRYGFNGMEKDDEMKGNGNSLDFGARIYDPRLGKFLSMDNFTSKYPQFSPFSYAANTPILLIDKDGNEPSIDRTAGVTETIHAISRGAISDLQTLQSATGRGRLRERYLYSEKWGWIDMKHFAKAARQTDDAFLSGHKVLELGEGVEKQQASSPSGNYSAWSYEDLNSNLLGVYFESYLESEEAKGKDFATNLENYLTQLGFVEEPLEVAPNVNSMPENEVSDTPADLSRPPTARNTTYDPMYTTKPQDGALDKKIIQYRNEYLKGKEHDRSKETKKGEKEDS